MSVTATVSTKTRLFLVQLAREESGADAFEYCMVLALISMIGVAGVGRIGDAIGSAIGSVAIEAVSSL